MEQHAGLVEGGGVTQLAEKGESPQNVAGIDEHDQKMLVEVQRILEGPLRHQAPKHHVDTDLLEQ
jgi:hypothetical protein